MAGEVELISAIFAGAGGLIIAVSKMTSDRSFRRKYQVKFQQDQIIAQEETIQFLQKQVVDAEGHIFLLEQKMALGGIVPPERPAILKAVAPKKIKTEEGFDL